MLYFDSINEFNQYNNLPEPEHPLFFIHSGSSENEEAKCAEGKISISSNFYTISLKHIISGNITYGRTKYDCDNGVMLFVAPKQILEMENVAYKSKAIFIAFHEDFIAGTKIRELIKKCNFFSYSLNEALHLTPKEEKMIQQLLETMKDEYEGNQDEYSKEIILSHLETLLKYSERFYNRQFIHRKEHTGNIISQFEKKLQKRFESGTLEFDGIPKIDEIAKELYMSSRYLSDALKKETGKTALEHIHLFLIDEAKNLLLEPNMTINEISIKLGFEYPQYFSRLFKNKVGQSPGQYRKEFSTR